MMRYAFTNYTRECRNAAALCLTTQHKTTNRKLYQGNCMIKKEFILQNG
jgi:hypothetical protein